MTNIIYNIYYHFFPMRKFDIICYAMGKNLERYLNMTDLQNVKLVNKELINNIYLEKEMCKKQIINKYFREWKHNMVYVHFKDTFFPEKLIRLLPVLSCKAEYIGGTDYIDCIKPKNLTNSIMVGVDFFRRPFITIKYKYQTKKERIGRITVFQRYSESKTQWVKCNHKGPLMLNDANSSFTNDSKILFVNNIARLLSEKPIIVNNYQLEGNYEQDPWFYNKTSTEVDCQLFNHPPPHKL